jgi:hypothetical protein
MALSLDHRGNTVADIEMPFSFLTPTSVTLGPDR